MLSRETIFSASVNPRFLIYLQARQNGAWLQTISGLTIDVFIKEYSLINTDFTKFPPVLLAHNTKDNDVPYAESLNLHHRIFGSKLISFNTDEHDFDKKTEHIDTQKLLNETIKFLNENMLKKAYK